jgi:Protein of unknown function (DUF4012)
VAVVILLLVVASFSAYRSLSQARRLLNQAHVTITASIGNESNLTSSSGRTKALLGVAQVSADAAQAEQDLHSSFGLSVLGVLPLLHTQRQGLLQLVDDLKASATTGGILIRQVDTLASASAGTNIAIPQLRQLQTTVAAAHKQFASYDRPSTGLWGPLGTAQREFDREDSKITRLLADGNRAMSYALPFLGTDGPRTYLVMGENNAEMRDEGSTLSYSLVHTNNGVITESPGGSVDNIEPTAPVPGVPIPAGTEAEFGELDPTGIWQSTNATANFTFSGLDMDRMLANTTGVDVDGVIGIDVVALEALLGLTGPVTVAGIPEPVTSENAAYVLLDQLYAGLPAGSSQGSRREALAAVASAVFHQLGVQKIDVIDLARTLATETTERHLQLWDSNSRYERTIMELGASGDIDTDDPTRTFHVAVENATATKLDYFVDVAVSDTVTIAANGSAAVDTAVKLTNHAPSGQPPSYQLGPDDVNSFVSGEYVGRVFLWGPRGSVQKGSVDESGLLLANEVDVLVMPGKSATVHFATTIPNAIRHNQLRLIFVPQPRLAPESLAVHVLASGTQTTVRRSLTKTTTLTWEFQRT